jgi:hypothetical protein
MRCWGLLGSLSAGRRIHGAASIGRRATQGASPGRLCSACRWVDPATRLVTRARPETAALEGVAPRDGSAPMRLADRAATTLPGAETASGVVAVHCPFLNFMAAVTQPRVRYASRSNDVHRSSTLARSWRPLGCPRLSSPGACRARTIQSAAPESRLR